MEQFFDLLIQYVPYIAIPLIVAGLVQSAKKAFKKFFTTQLGARLLPFIPVALGTPLGLALPLDGCMTKLLVGAALGTVSAFIYKVVTVTLSSKLKLDDRMTRKSMDLPEDHVD